MSAYTNATGIARFQVLPEAQMKMELTYHGVTHQTEPTTVSEDTQLSVQTLAFALNVTNSTGYPIENVRVNLRRSNNRNVMNVRTNASGIAKFEVLPGAQMRFQLDYNGGTYTTNVTTVTENTMLALQTLAFALSISDSTGAPIEKVRVYLRP